MRLTIRNSDGTVSQPMNLDWAAALEKLAAYEDAEDQGLLVRLPFDMRCSMTDYDALVKALRELAEDDNDEAAQAADAIEELQAGEKKFLRNISALEMENENLKRARRWIPATEQLPGIGEYVLVRYKNNDMAVACWFDGDEDILFWRAMTDEGWCADCDTEPTHWMPLPTPPKEET